jgi:hypothetical protein
MNIKLLNAVSFRCILIILIMTICPFYKLYSQEEVEKFPKITGFVAIFTPLVTFNSEETTTNFSESFIVGMPIGINVWKSKRIGFSFELVPTIKSDSEISKTNNILIHPGILVKLNHGYTFAGRAAFETSGRYGFTPVISKVIKKYDDYAYYVSVPLPVRFGNDKPTSISLGFQLGISF